MSKDKKPTRRNALGRGLSALLEDAPGTAEELTGSRKSVNIVRDVDPDTIGINPFQPRTRFDEEALKELAHSIGIHGLIQPVTVRQLGRDRYQLISGERRLRAAKMAGLEKIPAFIRTADDAQMLEMALIENVQREDLNAIEIALSYQRLISECDLNQEEIGNRVGKNRSTVTNYLRLLKLPPDVQLAVRDNEISMGHARALIALEHADVLLSVFCKVVRDHLSVRQTEEMVRKMTLSGKQAKNGKKDAGSEKSPFGSLARDLSSHFGTKVVIKNEGEKGEIRIPFYSSDDFNRILEILKS